MVFGDGVHDCSFFLASTLRYLLLIVFTHGSISE